MFEDKAPYIIFLAICHLVVLLLFVIILLRLVYLLVRKKNTNRGEKIGAIALTAIIFNKTLQQSILIPVQVLVINLQKLFYLAYAYANLDNNMNLEGKNKILETNPLNEQIISVQQIFENYPLAKMVTAIAFAILIYFFIVYIKRNNAGNKEQKPETQVSKSVLFYNSIILSVLILSLFLVISVCITIPYLNQISKPTAFTIVRLDSTLSEYSSKDSFKVIGIDNSPFGDSSIRNKIFVDTVKKDFEKLNFSDKQKINNAIADFEQMYNLRKIERENSIKNLNKFSKDYKFKEGRYKRNLLVNYENESQSINVDKGSLFQSSVRYFADFVQGEKDGFDNTIQSIFYSDAYNFSAKNNSIEQIKNAINEFSKNNKRDSSYNPYASLYGLTPNFLTYHSYIEENNEQPFIPAYIKTGSEWGFFGFMANYLIKTQSSELVLLMGMFGFGLLGASLLAFRQSDGTSNDNVIESFKTKPLIINFGNVLARGFGAALVIYLATKGGLAIFSAGTSTDANGYILLLTCFVGAVFSEKVWNKIQKTLYSDDKEKVNGQQNTPQSDKTKENPSTDNKKPIDIPKDDKPDEKNN